MRSPWLRTRAERLKRSPSRTASSRRITFSRVALFPEIETIRTWEGWPSVTWNVTSTSESRTSS